MSWQTWRALVAVWCAGLLAGGAVATGAQRRPIGASGAGAGGSGKRVHLIGFDVSEPVITGLRQTCIPISGGARSWRSWGCSTAPVTTRSATPGKPLRARPKAALGDHRLLGQLSRA